MLASIPFHAPGSITKMLDLCYPKPYSWLRKGLWNSIARSASALTCER